MSLAQVGHIPTGPLPSKVRKNLRCRPSKASGNSPDDTEPIWTRLVQQCSSQPTCCLKWRKHAAACQILPYIGNSAWTCQTVVRASGSVPYMVGKPTRFAKELAGLHAQVLGQLDLTQILDGPEEAASADTRGLTTPVSSGVPFLSDATQVTHSPACYRSLLGGWLLPVPAHVRMLL